MACHVSASPNHQTGRVIPLKFRFDVGKARRNIYYQTDTNIYNLYTLHSHIITGHKKYHCESQENLLSLQ